MKAIVQDFIKTHPKDLKIKYVRNIYGYKTGVVVKIGQGKDAKIGWSMVHSREDSLLRYRKPHQLPIWQWMERNNVPYPVILAEPFYHRLLENGCFISIPDFDRYKGLALAIDKALSNEVSITSNGTILIKDAPIHTNLALVLADIVQH